jgi:hypothetical protein
LGRSQLRVVLSLNAAFAGLAVCAMVIEREISLSLGIFGVAYLLNVCCLALGADWARLVSAGFSAIVVIASLLIIFTRHSFDATTIVSAAFGVSFAWSAYVLYFSQTLRAEIEERWLQSQKNPENTR